MWLKDVHIESQRFEAHSILVTAAQMVVCEESSILTPPKKVDAEMLGWCLESVWHYCWLLQYYDLLCITTERITWRESRELKTYCEFFPQQPFRMLDHDGMRTVYQSAKGVYKKNRPPFWYRKAVDVGPIYDVIDDEFS